MTTKPTMTLTQLMDRFSTEEACKQFLQDKRWPNGVRCPRCQNEKVYALKARPFHWVCKGKKCGGRNGYRFSVITKTIVGLSSRRTKPKGSQHPKRRTKKKKPSRSGRFRRKCQNHQKPKGSHHGNNNQRNRKDRHNPGE